MRRRYTTRTEDRAFILRKLADLHRDWREGDATLPYKTCNPVTTISRFEGERVHLADGTVMHRSHLKTPVTR